MRVNRQIRVPRVRVINKDGEQIGIMTVEEALRAADSAGLDLVEIVPTAVPPVCRIIDYGKFLYDQAKRDKENKKAQHQIKVKEVKIKPNIDDHDLETKMRHAREFLEKGDKVKVTCQFRGREMAHPEIGVALMKRVQETLQDCASVDAPPNQMGRLLIMILSPGVKKKSEKVEKKAAPAAGSASADAPLAPPPSTSHIPPVK